jgi:hypothetical protein
MKMLENTKSRLEAHFNEKVLNIETLFSVKDEHLYSVELEHETLYAIDGKNGTIVDFADYETAITRWQTPE